MSAVKMINEGQTRNEILVNMHEPSYSLYKPNHLALFHLPSYHHLLKQSSKRPSCSYSKKIKSSDFFGTSKEDNSISLGTNKKNNNSPSSSIKLPLLLDRIKQREKSYIVNEFKVPEVCSFHSKLLKNSFHKSISSRSSSLINLKMNHKNDLDISNIKKRLFNNDIDINNNGNEDNKEEEDEKKTEREKELTKASNPLVLNLFDNIYRNKKKMTNTIKKLLSDEVFKAKQHIMPFKCIRSNRNLPMPPLSKIKLKKHNGSMTDINAKNNQNNFNEIPKKQKDKIKKVNWDFINKDTLKNQNTGNMLKISKYASPNNVIRNDSIVKQMLSHNLTCLLNID